MRSPYLDRQTGEAGPGAHVDDVNLTLALARFSIQLQICLLGKQMAGGKERLSQVTGHNFFRLSHRCEIDASVPAQ